MIQLHQLCAAIYLAAGLLAALGLALPAARWERAAAALLGLGALVQGIAFASLHRAASAPPLTDLAAVMSFMAWIGTLFFLALLPWRTRLYGLVILVAPMAFLGVFFAAVRLPHAGPATLEGSGSWPHAHVLLASAGLSLLGLAGLASLLFLAEHRRLKAKRPLDRRVPLPSLESLDRTSAVALALGFPLLTLGVVTGAIWLDSISGTLWRGSAHELWTLLAWVLYAVLVAIRFGAHQGSRQAAVSAVGGFAFILFAVFGVGLFR